MLLARKLFRELWTQKGQVLAVLAVTSLGVALFAASAGAYVDLRDSYAATRARLALAGLHVDADDVTAADVARVAALPGARAAESRLVAPVPLTLGDERVELRLISLPDAAPPALDRVHLVSGRLPAADDEVVLEKHLAQHHHLGAGALLRVAAADGERRLRVVGVGVAAEYLWVARDEHDVMPSPDAFGVGWMRHAAVRALAGATPAGDDQLLVDCAAADCPPLATAVRGTLGAARVRAVTAAAELPGVRLLQMDVDGYKGMAGFFPLLFLGVGAFIVAAILGRLVDAQRAIIGTWMALGVGRARVLGHYLAYALVLGGGGALLGAAGGVALAPAMTHAYATDLGIPFVTARLHWTLALEGIAIGVAVALAAGAMPAWHACRLLPAEAMRPPRPSTGPLARAARHLGASLPFRMALRDLLGRPLRSLGTAVGVAAALLLVLTTGAMLDSMRATFGALFSDARRYDLRVDLVAPAPAAAVDAKLRAVPGVTAVEDVVTLPATLEAGGRVERDVLVDGLAKDAALLRAVDLDGRVVPPAAGGIVLGRPTARKLGVGIGDRVTVRLASTGATARLVVSGFADATLGKGASARRADLDRAFALGGAVTSAVLRVRPAELDAARRAIAALPDAAHVEDVAALRAQMRDLMSLGWVMLLTMLLCSVVLAAAILFNTATLGILERRRELATLRALGRTLREISVGLTIEHTLVCVAGLALGFPVALVVIRRVLTMFSSDLFQLPFIVSPATVATAVIGILIVLLVAQWPALRQVGRASLADAVRSREG